MARLVEKQVFGNAEQGETAVTVFSICFVYNNGRERKPMLPLTFLYKKIKQANNLGQLGHARIADTNTQHQTLQQITIAFAVNRGTLKMIYGSHLILVDKPVLNLSLDVTINALYCVTPAHALLVLKWFKTLLVIVANPSKLVAVIVANGLVVKYVMVCWRVKNIVVLLYVMKDHVLHVKRLRVSDVNAEPSKRKDLVLN